ncbi:MAG: oxidoreductase [Planctomycetaceae bacterium]|nr:oxidoreductase [Planctomycetaceae bacterium]
MDQTLLLNLLGAGVVLPPLLLFALLGLATLFARPLSEKASAVCTESAVVTGLLAAVAILGLMLATGMRYVPIEFGDWVVIPQERFHFHFKLVFDRLSVPFAILTFVLVGTVGAFANRYLHREPGYNRYFMLFAVFLLGMTLASRAGTIEVLVLGWELVGRSSALLVAFLHDRASPVQNGQRVWSIYRVADAAFLIGAIVLHHSTGAGDFAGLMGSGPWPEGVAALSSSQALIIGSLLLVAAAGKSALLPFSGWLPRAMEGPTPSSAIFYGALSVHLGTFLLLRVSPVIELSPWLSGAVVVLGLASAVFGSMAARVQSDVKSALAFASLTQVGIITAEIGLGFRYVALVHIIGHASLRTLQLLRAPSLLQDYHALENAVGGRLRRPEHIGPKWLSPQVGAVIYRFALDRGSLDSALDAFVVRPFVAVFRWCDQQERRWAACLAGEPIKPAADFDDVEGQP